MNEAKIINNNKLPFSVGRLSVFQLFSFLFFSAMGIIYDANTLIIGNTKIPKINSRALIINFNVHCSKGRQDTQILIIVTNIVP